MNITGEPKNHLASSSMKRSRDEEDIDEIGLQRAAESAVAPKDDERTKQRSTNTIQSLPPEIVAIVLSFHSDSFTTLTICSRVSKSWRKALSKIERVCVEFISYNFRRNNVMLRFATSQLQNITDLSFSDNRVRGSYHWPEISRLASSCSLKLKHFKFRRESWHKGETCRINDEFDSLQNAAQLESLTFECSVFSGITSFEKMLQNKPLLRKLKLEGLMGSGSAGDFNEVEQLAVLIGKLHTLRELHFTGYFRYFDEIDPDILLSGLKDLQYLHVCVPADGILYAIDRCCPALKHLHIADYGVNNVRMKAKHVMYYLESSAIHTLNLSSSLYDDPDGACSWFDIERIFRLNTTLRKLIVDIQKSDDYTTEADFIALVAEKSKGRVELVTERIFPIPEPPY